MPVASLIGRAGVATSRSLILMLSEVCTVFPRAFEQRFIFVALCPDACVDETRRRMRGPRAAKEGRTNYDVRSARDS